MKIESNKLIVVGANGYIGRCLFNEAQKKLNALGTTSTGNDNFIKLKLDDSRDFDYEIIDPFDTVFLTAAISAPDACANDYEKTREVNVVGTSRFIEGVIQRGARVIFFSSDTVYGEQFSDFDEGLPVNPVGEYAHMKQEIENQFLNNESFKVIRLSYVFSASDKFTKYLINCAEKGEPAEIFHPFYRSIIHREDVVEGLIALASRWQEFPQKIFNFGGPESLSRLEFSEILREIALPNLSFKIVEPDLAFFKSRPREIRMQSPILSQLIGRPVRNLKMAAEIEFNNRRGN